MLIFIDFNTYCRSYFTGKYIVNSFIWYDGQRDKWMGINTRAYINDDLCAYFVYINFI